MTSQTSHQTKIRNFFLVAVVAIWQLIVPVGPVLTMQTAHATNDKVTICHRTNSASNPYTTNTVDSNAVDGDNSNENGNNSDHFGEHKGDVFDSSIHSQQNRTWGDIIPPVAPHHDGLNWTTEGQAIWNNDCNIPNPVPKPSSITIEKDAVPGSEQNFDFTSNVTGYESFTLDDEDGTTGTGADNVPESVLISDLSAGEYTFTEAATAGW